MWFFFFPKLLFLGYLLSLVSLKLQRFFQGNSQVVFLSKEGSNAQLRDPCPEISAHFLTRASPSSGSFVVRNGPRDNSNSHKHCTWNGTWIHGFYLKMPQHSEFELPQPKELHAQAALSHWKFRVSFLKYFKKTLIFFSVSEDTSAPLNTVISFHFKGKRLGDFISLSVHWAPDPAGFWSIGAAQFVTISHGKATFLFLKFNFLKRQRMQRQGKPPGLIYTFIYSLKDFSSVAHN